MHRDCQAMASWDGAMCLNCCDLCNQESWATRKDYAKLPKAQSFRLRIYTDTRRLKIEPLAVQEIL
jgi:hypothetical protein